MSISPLSFKKLFLFFISVFSFSSLLSKITTWSFFSFALFSTRSFILASSYIISAIGTYPITASRNSLNKLPCTALVKKSANINSVGQYDMFILPDSTLSFTKKYRMSMCLEFPVHEFLPFTSIFIALWLSWYRILFLKLYPWYSKKFVNQMWKGRYSLTPTSSASVELLAFIFCFDDFVCIKPCPSDMAPPVCPLMLGCTAYDASTHVHRVSNDVAPKILLSSIVFFK